MLIAEKNLQRHERRQQPKGHRQHRARFDDEAPAPQIEGGDADDDKGGSDIEADDRVRQPIGKGGVEDDLSPRLRKETSVDDLVARRRLHPTVGGENPKDENRVPPATISAATK